MPDPANNLAVLVQIRQRIDILLARLHKDRQELSDRQDMNRQVMDRGIEALDAAIAAMRRTAGVTQRKKNYE